MKKAFFRIICLSLIIIHLATACFHGTAFAEGLADSFAPEKAIKNFYLDPYSGALSLSIPLVTPPGRQGIQPALNLTYSSRNANGPFGWGWNLDFFGFIERSTKGGVPKYDSTDDTYIYSLGGVTSELVAIGQDEYRPKDQGNSLTFKFNGTSWRVTDKQGKAYYFGRDYTSRFVPPPNSYISVPKVFRWKLDGIKDVNGNTLYLSYDYKKNFPIKIGYTVYQPGTDAYSAPTNAPFSVEFTTNPLGTSRLDKTYDFRSSGPNSSLENYITQITVKAYPSTVIRKYLFDYKYSLSSNRLLLTKITEQGSDGAQMPPVTFTYQEAPQTSYQVIPVSTESVPTGDNLWNIRVDDSVENNLAGVNINGNPLLYPLGFNFGLNYRLMDWSQIYTQASGSDKGLSWDIAANGDLSLSGPQGSAFYGWTYVYVRNDCTLNMHSSVNAYLAFFLNGDYEKPYQYYLRRNNDIALPLKAGYNLIEMTGYNRLAGFTLSLTGNIPAQVEFMRSAQATTPSLSGDFNADGLDDIGTFSASSGKVDVALSNSSNFSPKQTWIENFGVNQRLLLGDFNGDAKTDICAFDAASGNWRVALSNGTSFIDAGIWLSGFGAGLPTAAADFNADGKTDICVFSQIYSKATVQSAFSNGGSFQQQTFVVDSGEYDDSTLSLGEFNGDGLVDFASYKVSGGGLKALFFYTGVSVDSSNRLATSEVIFGDRPRLFADFNADGLTDVAYYDYPSGKIKVRPFNGWSFSASTFDLPFDFQLRDASIQIQSGDYNGDGIQDFAAYNALGNLEIALSANGEVPDLLSKVENGLGGSLELKYTHSDASVQMPFVVPVLAESKVSDGRGNSYATAYAYSDGLYDLQNKEFRGFSYTRVTDAEGNSKENYFLQDDIYKGKLYKQEIKDKDGKLLSKTENTWQHPDPEEYPGTYSPYLSQTDTYTYNSDGLTYAQIQQIFEYDKYGNPIKAASNGEVREGEAVTGDERTQITEYVYNLSNSLLSLPKHTVLLGQNQNKVSEVWFYYDGGANIDDIPAKGLLTKEEKRVFNPVANTNSNIVTQYTYDKYGNLKTTTDALGRVTQIAYDTVLYTYPLTTTNALSQTITTTYDTKTGNLLTSTDPNAKVTTNVYDSLGQLIKVIGPLDTAAYPGIIYEYDLTSQPNRITKKVKADYSSPPNYLSYHSFYDGLSRLIEEKSSAEDEPGSLLARQVISGVAKFDSRGKIKEKYLPYFTNAPSADFISPSFDTPYSTFTYDALGRLTQVINPDSTASSVAYSGWVMTITDENSHPKTKTFDAYGRIKKIEEFNESQTYTTTYEYDALDNLTRLIDNQGNITQVFYDSLGRKVQMDDPDMGIWNYEYDAVGNLVKQADAKGQVLEFQYDALNRLNKKQGLSPQGTVPVFSVEYSYDDTSKPNSIGRLSKVTDLSGSTEFFYDAIGREIKSTKVVTGSGAFTVERSYDALDRLLSLKYPDGEVINYVYNPQGIEQVKGLSLNYVSNLDYSPTGQITKIKYANAAETSYTYDPKTLRLSSLMTYSAQGKIQDLNYQFDNAGNIKEIMDYVNTASQSFIYDDLNRLIKAVGSYGSFSYDYDSIANMLHKEGVSLTYGHNNRLPHAVTQYGSIAIDYDANGNILTKTGPQSELRYSYDLENRLAQVEDQAASQPITHQSITITLSPGWNFFSFPLVPPNAKVSSVLSSLEGKYDQVSRYNPAIKKLEHYVGNSKYSQFDTFEYGRGYQIYITGQETLTLTLNGTIPLGPQATALKSGYNLIFNPQTIEQPAEDALLPLKLGIDYSKLLYYDKPAGLFREYSLAKKEFSGLKPGGAYYLYSLKDTLWTIPSSPQGAVSSATSFIYDADGSRVKKTLPSGLSTTYIGPLFEKDSDGSMRKHIFAGGNRIATVSLRGAAAGSDEAISTNYYHSDHLGSSNVITDESGSQAAHYEYTPYGSVIASPDSSVIVSPAGAKQSRIAHFFTDKELDNTGLYFFEARYYDPELAHFTSVDSIVAGLDDPQNLNPYSYCLNNPVNYTDPSGLVPDWNGQETEVVNLPPIYVTPNAYTNYTVNDYALDDISFSSNPTGSFNNFAYQPVLYPGYSSFGNNVVINAAQNFLVDTATIKGGAQLIQGANYSTPQGWLEGGVGAIGIAAATADAGLNFATGGVKGAATTVTKWAPKGGRVMLGRFGKRYMPQLEALAKKYRARILKDPFPKGISLKEGLEAEIDAAKKIYFRWNGVKPGKLSYDIEYSYIKSKNKLMDKTEFLFE